jgi:hypothetical protein
MLSVFCNVGGKHAEAASCDFYELAGAGNDH